MEGKHSLAVTAHPRPSRVDCPSFFCVRGRRSAPSLCLRAKTLERLALLSPHTCATWGLETPAFAQTCETCETWPELVLKLVGICVKLVKLVKLGRKITLTYFSSKFHEFHEFHANTNKFQDELFPSFTSFTCLGCFGRQTQPCCNCSPQTVEALNIASATNTHVDTISVASPAACGPLSPSYNVEAQYIASSTLYQGKGGHRYHVTVLPLVDRALCFSAPHLQYLGLQPSRVDCPSFFCVRGRRSAPSLCLRAKTLERLALLSPHTCATWGLETPAFAQTCETCETWPELVLKLVGICVKLVKLVKLGRKITLTYFSSKFHEFHEFHANTNKFQDELFPSFTSFTCLGCFGRQTQPCCNCSPQTVSRRLSIVFLRPRPSLRTVSLSACEDFGETCLAQPPHVCNLGFGDACLCTDMRNL